MDVWLMVCFVFTFLVCFEYCAVLYLCKISDWYDINKIEGSKKKMAKISMMKPWKRQAAYTIERWARVLLPAAFALFVSGYIAYYANRGKTADGIQDLVTDSDYTLKRVDLE